MICQYALHEWSSICCRRIWRQMDPQQRLVPLKCVSEADRIPALPQLLKP